MSGPASTWLHVSGYRFLLRRIECALLHHDVGALGVPLRARTASLGIGSVLAIIVVLGCAFVAVLRPQVGLGSAQIVMGQKSGALYVRVGDVWHPVLNLASARLITGTDADPQPVRESELGSTRRGPLLGIPGAPQLLTRPLSAEESVWTICDSGGRSTAVVVGPVDRAAIHRLAAEDSVLVTTAPGAPVYLLYNGQRALVDVADPAVRRALRLEGRAARVVAQPLLNVIPEASPIEVPRIRRGGRASARPPGFAVGSVLRVARADGDEHYVVLDDGVQRIGQLAADLLRFADAQGSTNVIAVAPDVIRAAVIVNSLPVSTFPDHAPRPWDEPPGKAAPTLCATWASEHSGSGPDIAFSAGSAPPVLPGQVPVVLSQADGPGPRLDAVYLPPGRIAYVVSQGLSGGRMVSRAGTRYLVTDTGVRFGIHDDEAAHALGLSSPAIPAWWAIVATLPSGPELSRANALVARDAVAAGSP